ncbi:MAG: hypothetical protein K940chlam1_00620 [Candidatus Anoxychlamydiales bacterium]|nr:hypothetical protein [Candidatus Anoxychlamydiales bacterium]NGX36073.1 hypothetical protein [Candidatus Anoxychlamydiales bacterium]
MSVSAAKPYVQKAYDEIKVIVNDANRQIANYNFKTIAKIAALFVIFTLGGAFAYLGCIKLGASSILAGLTGIPTFLGLKLGCVEIIARNKSKQFALLKRTNNSIQSTLNMSSYKFNKAVNLQFPYTLGGEFTINKIEIDSYDQIKKRYENEKGFSEILPSLIRVFTLVGLGIGIGVSQIKRFTN